MTIRNAVVTVVGCMALLAALGGLAGYALGLFAPNYYRDAFPNGRSASFDPITIGVGQGVTQGMAGGALVGLGLVLLLSWREIKLQQASGTVASSNPAPAPQRSTASLLFRTVGVLLVLGFFTGAGYVSGLLVGETGEMWRHSARDRYALQNLRESDRAFRDLRIEIDSQGEVWISGTVQNSDDLQKLQSRLSFEFGQTRAAQMMHGITVKPGVDKFVQP